MECAAWLVNDNVGTRAERRFKTRHARLLACRGRLGPADAATACRGGRDACSGQGGGQRFPGTRRERRSVNSKRRGVGRLARAELTKDGLSGRKGSGWCRHCINDVGRPRSRLRWLSAVTPRSLRSPCRARAAVGTRRGAHLRAPIHGGKGTQQRLPQARKRASSMPSHLGEALEEELDGP